MPTRAIAVGALFLIAIVLCFWAGLAFVRVVSTPPPVIEHCEDHAGLHTFSNPAQAGYRKCVEDRAKLFLTYDYAESKDASKAFLTLLTAVFVASITFSEKIVDMQRSGWLSRGMMISCWVLLLISIACCGAALVLVMTAASYAAYNPHLSYWVLGAKAVYLYISAGLSFGGSLVALLVAGIISLVYRRPQAGQEG